LGGVYWMERFWGVVMARVCCCEIRCIQRLLM
jgi:hypothetical protein